MLILSISSCKVDISELKICVYFFTADSDFNIESVRQQLMQEYKETRSTLPLLPGMPEECAKMEDLFVDLVIVKEDWKPTGVITKELKACGDLVCIERKKGDTKEVEQVKRILVRGKPGAGKSSTVSKLAYDWACNKQDSPISKYQLLFAITINEIETDTDLIDIIQDQLLPEVSGEALRAYIQSNASSICVLFDGYDEATKYFHLCKDVRNVLCSKWLADACVIVTTRPNEVGKFCQNYGPFTQVEVKGFSFDGRQKYVDKFFQMSEESESDISTGKKVITDSFFDAIRNSQRLYQLSYIPIILSMLCMLWVEDANLPVSVTSLYNEVIMHFAKHRFAKNTKDELDITSIQTWVENVLFHIGKTALEGLVEDKLVFKASSFEKKQLEDACSLGVVIKERKRSRMSVNYHVTFLHKTFMEYCAALYWGLLVDTERKKFHQHLEEIRGDNVFEMEYFLRFACGLSVKAAEIILPHVVQIMCQHDQFRDRDGNVRSVQNNTCQQIPLFLLHEAEANNSNIKESCKLHSLLKPLFSTLVARDRTRVDQDEFFQMFFSFTAFAHDYGTSTQRNLPWLADVEHVEIYDSPVACEAILSGFSQIANMIEQHTMSQLHSGQGAPDTDTCLAIGNIERDLDIQGTGNGAGKLQKGLNVENLKVSSTVIGIKSVEKFAQAYKYMPHLRRLDLQLKSGWSASPASEPASGLTQSRYAVLFDGFVAAGKMLSQQDEISSDTRVSGSGAPQGGLIIEHLDLSYNDLGESVEKLAQAYQYMPRLRFFGLKGEWLKCHLNPSQCAVLFDAFIIAGMMLSKQDDMSSDVQVSGSGTSQSGLDIEHLDLSQNDIGESVEKLAQAYKYMPRLRRIDLNRTKLNPSHCATLFDAFIAVGKMLSHQGEISSDAPVGGSGASQSGLSIEHLGLSGNNIGESVKKLAQSYKYMPRLRRLDLPETKLNTSQCAVLFDGFIAAGATLSQQAEMSRDSQGSGSGESQGGLSIEYLGLSFINIGESADKLLQALRFMPHLTHIDVQNCKLDEKTVGCMDEMLKQINPKFKQRNVWRKVSWDLDTN